MKTTVELPDSLLRSAKLLAARRGTTMRELMIEGLRRVLEHPRGSPEQTLSEEEAMVATLGPGGIPLLKRRTTGNKKVVTNAFVNGLRDEMAI